MLFPQFHRAFTTVAIVLLALGAAPIAERADAQQTEPLVQEIQRASQLIGPLQGGGLVMLIRHERTEVPSRRDDYSKPPEECRAQRNLSLAGVAGAQETGVNIRALGINVGRVISSPMCRSAETARYMFGVEYETDTRLMHHDPAEGATRNLDAAEVELRELLSELSPGLEGSNIALISHGGNIFRVSGLRISEGEIAVLRLGPNGEIEALGQFMGSDLGPFARMKLAEQEE